MVLQLRIFHLQTGILKNISHKTCNVPSLFWIKVISCKTSEQKIIIFFHKSPFYKSTSPAVGCNSPVLTLYYKPLSTLDFTGCCIINSPGEEKDLLYPYLVGTSALILS